MWVQHYLACDGSGIRGVTVHSQVNANNDGIDIDCCQRVRIADCDIGSGDDAIVLKSTANRPAATWSSPTASLSTHCNAFKLGTESNGGFENIVVSNCTIYDTRLAGIARRRWWTAAMLDRVSFSNIVMRQGRRADLRAAGQSRPAVRRRRSDARRGQASQRHDLQYR